MLEKILAEVRKGIEGKKEVDLTTRLTRIQSLENAIRKAKLPLIAEIKRKSPTEGRLRKNLDVVEQARAYMEGGAAAISVVTEKSFFGGRLKDLISIKQEVDLPLLRKDFIISEYQIHESYAYEADAILLIAGVVKEKLSEYLSVAKELKLDAIVECHTREEIDFSTKTGARIIGINNRNLQTMEVSLEKTRELAPYVPKDILLISESGIRDANDIKFLLSCGAHAVLVGTALMRAPNPKQLLQSWRWLK